MFLAVEGTQKDVKMHVSPDIDSCNLKLHCAGKPLL